ncbi:classical arabinogalactan protein 9 [Drosophila elegans]|uniref:classical arabinogalactan protein 9 n=1 Tax=Drosophila elegans TaxID=30023 RepID=UPI0007E7993C|nr:classical arabinogalactan protein 9 [Drosophila elegans]
MSARRNILVAVGCCLVFNILTIEARSLEETAVRTKRDSSDWWTLLEDIIYDSDTDDDVDTESYLICSNCTVVVQSAPNATAGGGTVAPPAPGSATASPVTPPGSNPAVTAPPATSAPAITAPPAVTTAPVQPVPPAPAAAPGG